MPSASVLKPTTFLVAAFAVCVVVAEAYAEKAKAVRCKEFDSTMVKSKTVNSIKVYIHTLEAVPASGITERCSAEFPPLNFCTLSQHSEGGSKRRCNVTWARSIVDAGRWILHVRNDDTKGNNLVCSMICF